MRIVLVRQRPAIGDCLLLSPLIRAIKDRHPNSELTVVTDSGYSDGALPLIFAGIPGVDKVVCIPPHIWTTESNLEADADLERMSFETPTVLLHADIVYDCNGAFINYEREFNGNPQFGIAEFWTRHHNVYEPGMDLRPRFVVSAAARLKADRLLNTALTGAQELIGVVLRAGDPVRDWNFNGLCARVAEYIHSVGYTPVGIDRSQTLISEFGFTLPHTSVDVVAALLERCKLVISPDTGLLHLAEAVRTPTVAVWGIMDPKLRVDGYNTTIVPETSLGYCQGEEETDCTCWKFQRYSCLRRLTISMVAAGMNIALGLTTSGPQLPKEPILTRNNYGRAIYREADVNLHRLDVNPEAIHFQTADAAATEYQYLDLLDALLGVFMPSAALVVGSWCGDSAESLLRRARPGCQILLARRDNLSGEDLDRLKRAAESTSAEIELIQILPATAQGKYFDYALQLSRPVSFAYLHESIPLVADAFDAVTNPANEILDFTRPICICVHDMSRYRHPSDSDTDKLADAINVICSLADQREWQSIQLNQSRGILVFVKSPNAVGIDGECSIPASLLRHDDSVAIENNSGNALVSEYLPGLSNLAQRLRPQSVLQFGVGWGYSLCAILDGADTITLVTAVDVVNPTPEQIASGTEPGAYWHAQTSLANLKRTGRWPSLLKLIFLVSTDPRLDNLEIADRSIDLAHLSRSTSKKAIVRDLTCVIPYMSPSGAIIVSGSSRHGLTETIRSWAESNQFASKSIDDSSGVGLICISLNGYAT